MFKRLKIKILSELLHRANRTSKSKLFYLVKSDILKKYARHIGFDVQFIEGKKCHSCHGTGKYHSWRTVEDCYNCISGWYKQPVWNILERLQLGKYTFHIPFQKAYKKPAIESTAIIEGYIEHTPIKYGHEAHFLLMLYYEKGYLKRWYHNAGNGYYFNWWMPYRFINNLIHFYKKGRRAVLKYFREINLRKGKEQIIIINIEDFNDDLPF